MNDLKEECAFGHCNQKLADNSKCAILYVRERERHQLKPSDIEHHNKKKEERRG